MNYIIYTTHPYTDATHPEKGAAAAFAGVMGCYLTYFPPIPPGYRDDDSDSGEEDDDEDEDGLVNIAVELVDCYGLLFPATAGKKKTKETDVPGAGVMVDILLSLMSRCDLHVTGCLCVGCTASTQAPHTRPSNPLRAVVKGAFHACVKARMTDSALTQMRQTREALSSAVTGQEQAPANDDEEDDDEKRRSVPSNLVAQCTDFVGPEVLDLSLSSNRSHTSRKRKRMDAPTDTVCIFPPPVDGKPQPDSVTIVESEMFRLGEGELLNDSLIDFGLKHMHKRALFHSDSTPDQKIKAEDCHFFSSYFLTQLVSFGLLSKAVPKDDKNASWDKRLEQGFNNVKKWTKHVNIFEKKFLFIPVNASAHWSVVVVCNPGLIEMEKESSDSEGSKEEAIDVDDEDDAKEKDEDREVPVFVCMDSLNIHPLEKVCEILRKYLEMEWRCQKARDNEATAKAAKEAAEALKLNAAAPVDSACDGGR